MSKPSAFERLFREVGETLAAEAAYAVEDIRQKVIEAGVYGQEVTPSIHGNPESDRMQAFRAIGEGQETDTPEQDEPEREHGHELER